MCLHNPTPWTLSLSHREVSWCLERGWKRCSLVAFWMLGPRAGTQKAPRLGLNNFTNRLGTRLGREGRVTQQQSAFNCFKSWYPLNVYEVLYSCTYAFCPFTQTRRSLQISCWIQPCGAHGDLTRGFGRTVGHQLDQKVQERIGKGTGESVETTYLRLQTESEQRNGGGQLWRKVGAREGCFRMSYASAYSMLLGMNQ